jgi:hypothetical protein
MDYPFDRMLPLVLFLSVVLLGLVLAVSSLFCGMLFLCNLLVIISKALCMRLQRSVGASGIWRR